MWSLCVHPGLEIEVRGVGRLPGRWIQGHLCSEMVLPWTENQRGPWSPSSHLRQRLSGLSWPSWLPQPGSSCPTWVTPSLLAAAPDTPLQWTPMWRPKQVEAPTRWCVQRDQECLGWWSPRRCPTCGHAHLPGAPHWSRGGRGATHTSDRPRGQEGVRVRDGSCPLSLSGTRDQTTIGLQGRSL